MKMLGITLMALGLSIGGTLFAQTAPTTTTKPAALPCCGEKCKPMPGCCKLDAAGKATCAMGGGCCEKPATTPAH